MGVKLFMLRVTKLADYATVVLAFIGREPDKLHNARDISAKTHVALPTVSKILKLLTQKNIVSSVRGTKGGYVLARPAEHITVTEILAAIDGDFGITDCSQHAGTCNLETICSIRNHWRLISHTIFQALEYLTLADLVKPTKPKMHFTKEKTFASKTTVSKFSE